MEGEGDEIKSKQASKRDRTLFKVGNKKKSDVLSKVKGGTIELVTTQETPVTLENISSKRHVICYVSLHKKQPEYS